MSAVNHHLSQPVAHAGCDLDRARGVGVCLHGRGRDAADILSVVPRLGLEDFAWLAPTAAGGSWYPNRFMAPLAENQPFLDHALERLDMLVRGLLARGIGADRICLLGFSQGGCLVTEYAVRHARRYACIAAFTGGLVGPPGTAWPLAGRFGQTPVFLGSSDVDEWVPESRVRETAEIFTRMDARVNLTIYPGMGHEICDDEIRQVRAVLGRVPAPLTDEIAVPPAKREFT